MRLIIPVVFALFVASCGDSNQADADNRTDSSSTTSDSVNAGSMAANTLTDTEKMKAGSYCSTAKPKTAGTAITIQATSLPGKLKMARCSWMWIPTANTPEKIW